MNNPNPLVPQGSLLEQKANSKTSLPVAFVVFLAIHAVVLGGLLMVGCKPEDSGAKTKATAPTNDLPPVDAGSGAAASTNALYTPPPLSNDPIAHVGAPVGGIAPTNGLASAPVPPVPEPAPAAAPAGTTPASEYKVVKGDTFAVIAKKVGSTPQAMAKANPGVNSAKLKIGQTLQVPAGAAAPASATPAATDGAAAAAPASAGSVYTVKAGDNLTKIAKSHGTSSKAIKAANGLKTEKIHVGQKLKIPAGKAAAAPAEAAPAAAPATIPQAPLPVTPAPGAAPRA